MVQIQFLIYDQYKFNTLGYLNERIAGVSNGALTGIRPTCVDGRPEYEFIDTTTPLASTILPRQTLYSPIILSEERYNQLKPRLGHIIIDAKSAQSTETEGLKISGLNLIERKVFSSKAPLSEESFNYPIREVYVDVYDGSTRVESHIVIPESHYTIEQGNLYFIRPLEDTMIKSAAVLSEVISRLDANVHYKIHILFDRYLPDTSQDTHSLALGQATQYAIMDYFSQYTYAEVTGQMISEITYTEVTTLWSTIIGAVAVAFGDWATGSLKALLQQGGKKLTKTLLLNELLNFGEKVTIGALKSAIEEVYEEIVKDSFLETAVESIIVMFTGNQEMAFWASSLATSIRESGSDIRKSSKNSNAVKNEIQNQIAQQGSDGRTLSFRDKFEITRNAKETVAQRQKQEQQQKATWKKIFSGKVFKGIMLLIPSLFLGGFNIGILHQLINLGGYGLGKLKSSLADQNKQNTLDQQKKRNNIPVEEDISEENSEKITGVKPFGLSTEDINAKAQESGLDMQGVEIAPNINDPMDSRSKIVNKFNEISSENLEKSQEKSTTSGTNILDVSENLDFIKDKSSPWHLDTAYDVVLSDLSIGDRYEGLFSQWDKDTAQYIYTELIDPDSQTIEKPDQKVSKIKYPVGDIQQAVKILQISTYEGFDIITSDNGIPSGVNWDVQELIHEKMKSSEDLSNFEQLILCVGAYLMGGENRNLEDSQNKYARLLEGRSLNTEQFIEFLEKEFREFDPELYGALSTTQLRIEISKIIKGSQDFLKDILRKFSNPYDTKRYNPDYKFSIERLDGFKERLIKKFGEVPRGLSNLIEYYIESNHNLKLTPRQQYHTYNPDLDEFYFDNIDTKDKAYWLGFLLADGWISVSHNDGKLDRIGFALQKSDIDSLYAFCDALGLDKDKITPKEDLYQIRFGCQPMIERLLEIGFMDFKHGEAFPFASTLSEPFYKALILGFYDGDGTTGTSKIDNTNYKFLKQIKDDFNIEFKIHQRKHREGKNLYNLFLGASLFNSLMNNYRKSMERKRNQMYVRGERYENLKKLIGSAERLQKMVNTVPKYIIAKEYDVSKSFLNKLCKEWNIETHHWGSLSHEKLLELIEIFNKLKNLDTD
ncbi:MAG: LAGLIDADG family homing endonuclease [Candidatus Lokiarchaeota archaeon]